MIHLRDVLLRRGPEPLLEQATFGGGTGHQSLLLQKPRDLVALFGRR